MLLLSWVAKSCSTLRNPMDCSMPGFPILHYLPEFAWTHVRWVSDAIQSSQPLLPPSPSALNLFQHQGLFQWVSSLALGGQSIGASASVLPMNIQGWFPLELIGLISLLSEGLSRVFSSTTVRKTQFFSTQPSLFVTLNVNIPHWDMSSTGKGFLFILFIDKPQVLSTGVQWLAQGKCSINMSWVDEWGRN